MIMDKVDRWCKLLGTVLIKVGFVDPKTGQQVKAKEEGEIHLEVIHGGVYDIKYGGSPYYITELLIGFGKAFGGFKDNFPGVSVRTNQNLGIPGQDQSSVQYRSERVSGLNQLGDINRIYWTPDGHSVEASDGKYHEVKNPYGVIPAVPFFNQDPAHYYFLPINEPLIYANHAINMRITDLNHIAKFQSFGVPVVKGVERSKTVRQGRPVDDFNQLKGGSAQSRFGGIGGITGFGAGGHFRSFDAGLGIFRDGNADANALGISIGPDTAVAVGEKGDFKFAHPQADINGLVSAIQSISDMVRINHGLRPKHADNIPPSGFAHWMEKAGVIDENAGRRGKLFAEREAQLFQIIKKIYNTHNNRSGASKFSDNAKLKVTYQPPKFPLDPKTAMEKEAMEVKLLEMGDRQAYKSLYPHLPIEEINRRIKQRRKDKEEQAVADAKVQIIVVKMLEEAGITQTTKNTAISSRDTRIATSEATSMQSPGEGDSPVGVQNMDNKLKESQKKSKQYKTEKQVKPTE